MVARRRRPSSLVDLPTELAIRIAGNIAATSVQPMEVLRSLRATCHFMCCVCSDLEVGRLISVERFYRLYRYVVPDGYLTLLPRLAQVGNMEACFVIGMISILCYPLLRPLLVIDKYPERAAHGGHKAAAYVAVGRRQNAEQRGVLLDPREGHVAEILPLDEEKGGGVC